MDLRVDKYALEGLNFHSRFKLQDILRVYYIRRIEHTDS